MKTKHLFEIGIGLLICTLFLSMGGMPQLPIEQTSELQSTPQAQYYDWIAPFGDWWAVYDDADAGSYIDWSFSCSVNTVGIKVMAMDYSNFWDFYDGYNYFYYPLADGDTWYDSGTFTVPYYDEWYIVFQNNYAGGTYLTYDAIFYEISDDIYEENDIISSAAYLTEGYYSNLVALDDDCFYFSMNTGDSADIWTYFSDAGGDLDLKLYNYLGSLLASSTSSTDNENIFWTASYTGNYYIEVDTYYGTNLNYDLEIDIEAALVKSVEITRPTSSSSWEAGTSEYIFWDASGIDYVNLYLYHDGSYHSTIATTVGGSMGSYYWAIPSELGGINYEIKSIHIIIM